MVEPPEMDRSDKLPLHHGTKTISMKPRKAVLILQLGTPDDASVPAVRRYLAEFLSDRRIIEANRFLWWLLLHGVILRTRPAQSAAKYRRIWSPETGMPLLHYSQRQVDLLQQALGSDWLVRLGMRYGQPNLREVVPELVRDGVETIVALPMYPQYSATTTASALDGLFLALMKERRIPAIKVVPPYYDHPAFLGPMAALLRESLSQCPDTPDYYLLSYHGIPRRYAQKGDPYATHVERTTQALVADAGWSKGAWSRTYQSLFGRDKWLGPYTEVKLKELARQGRRRVFVATPGFTTDCLETIDEIGHEAAVVFAEAGGGWLHRCPCLNDDPRWIQGMARLVRETHEEPAWRGGVNFESAQWTPDQEVPQPT